MAKDLNLVVMMNATLIPEMNFDRAELFLSFGTNPIMRTKYMPLLFRLEQELRGYRGYE